MLTLRNVICVAFLIVDARARVRQKRLAIRGGAQDLHRRRLSPESKQLSVSGGSVRSRAEVGFFFGLWYALNVQYNIQNKRVLRVVELPWSVAVGQLVVGAVYSNILWSTGLRKSPEKYWQAIGAALPIAIAHGAGQACTVISLGAGAVSSTHVVKALEPLFSAAANVLRTGELLAPVVYLSLLPVVSGVALAVAKDVSFSLLSFSTAMGSNFFFAARAVLSKVAMTDQTTALADLSPASLFGIVTTAAALFTAPVAAVLELPSARGKIASASLPPLRLLASLVASGLFHYLNNEVMYLTLRRVHPVTLAVGNTLKRVILILASLLVLNESMQPLAALGAAIAIAGTLVYALVKQRFEQLSGH